MQQSDPSFLSETERAGVPETDPQSPSADEGRDVSVVYVCELPEVKGRFDIEKARKFFTRAGPHYGLLQAGKSVMSHDGKTMVRLPSWSSGKRLSLLRFRLFLLEIFAAS